MQRADENPLKDSTFISQEPIPAGNDGLNATVTKGAFVGNYIQLASGLGSFGMLDSNVDHCGPHFSNGMIGQSYCRTSPHGVRQPARHRLLRSRGTAEALAL